MPIQSRNIKVKTKRLLSYTIGKLLKLSGARIFFFHSVHPTHPLSVQPEIFRSMVKLIANSGKEVITIAEMGKRLRAGIPVDNCLSINFDDGYSDNHEIALPILQEVGLRATFFVAAGLIKDKNYTPVGLGRNQHLIENLMMMSKSQVKELSDAAMEIGSHSFSHLYMRKADINTVKQELQESKKLLEDIIGKPVVSFAFPNGEIPANVNVRKVLQKTGYLQAVTTQWDCVTPNSDPYFLPRQSVDFYDGVEDFRAKLDGKYDFMKIYVKLRKYAL